MEQRCEDMNTYAHKHILIFIGIVNKQNKERVMLEMSLLLTALQ